MSVLEPVGFLGTPGANFQQWTYRKPLAIAAGKVSGSIANLSPIVAAANDPDLFAHARGDGYDVRFAAPVSGTLRSLTHKRLYWTPGGSGVAFAYRILIPVAVAVGSVIYIYYGNAAASVDVASPAGAWDSDTCFAYDGDPALADDTGNCTLTNSGTTDAAGPVGRSRVCTSSTGILCSVPLPT